MKIKAQIIVTYEIPDNDISVSDIVAWDEGEWSDYKMVKHFQENGKAVDEKITVDDNGRSCYRLVDYSVEGNREQDNG